MYNRYIPQGDGSHKRRTFQEPQCAQKPCQRKDQPQKECPPPVTHPPEKCPVPNPASSQPGPSAASFLKNLIPGDFDTGDLMILLLLLLMAGDCQEDRNWAWLTLALYLFL